LLRLPGCCGRLSAAWALMVSRLCCPAAVPGNWPGCPAEAYGFATLDPATMLLTGSVRENIPDAAVALLAANEYGQDDYIKFAELARRAVPVGRLSAATRGDLARSRRYRDIFIPHGWRDELRAVFTTGDAGWGSICLHREQSSPSLTASEAHFLADLTGHVAAGLRKALLIAPAPDSTAEPGPGVMRSPTR
jgi:hypothetical protein